MLCLTRHLSAGGGLKVFSRSRPQSVLARSRFHWGISPLSKIACYIDPVGEPRCRGVVVVLVLQASVWSVLLAIVAALSVGYTESLSE